MGRWALCVLTVAWPLHCIFNSGKFLTLQVDGHFPSPRMVRGYILDSVACSEGTPPPLFFLVSDSIFFPLPYARPIALVIQTGCLCLSFAYVFHLFTHSWWAPSDLWQELWILSRWPGSILKEIPTEYLLQCSHLWDRDIKKIDLIPRESRGQCLAQSRCPSFTLGKLLWASALTFLLCSLVT